MKPGEVVDFKENITPKEYENMEKKEIKVKEEMNGVCVTLEMLREKLWKENGNAKTKREQDVVITNFKRISNMIRTGYDVIKMLK